MTGFPRSPRLRKGGLVLVDPDSAAVRRVIALQYNPDSLSRTFQLPGAGEGPMADALRIKGPPVETLKVEAEIDAADHLEHPDQNPLVVEMGLHPVLAALEQIVYPAAADLQSNYERAASGTLEIVPMESALVLFVWSQHRVVPVRVTELSITEEAFDPALNPIRAKVSLGMRVLSVDDVGFEHTAGRIYMAYHRHKETLAGKAGSAAIQALGIEALP